MNKLKKRLRQWLGIQNQEYRIETIENAVFHRESMLNGFAVPKKCLRDKGDKRYFNKEEI